MSRYPYHYLLIFLISCSSISSYWKDRIQDGMDIFEVTGGYYDGNGLFECGFHGSAGPIWGGIGTKHQTFGLKGGELGNFQNQGIVVIIYGKEAFYYDTADVEKLLRIQYRKKEFRNDRFSNLSNHTRLSMGGGCLLAFHAGINFGEALDFFLGIFNIDIYDDDFYTNMPIHIRTVLEKNK